MLAVEGAVERGKCLDAQASMSVAPRQISPCTTRGDVVGEQGLRRRQTWTETGRERGGAPSEVGTQKGRNEGFAPLVGLALSSALLTKIKCK